jgi:deoxyxylulose-5-phosphate synthase
VLEFKNENVEQSLKDLVLHTVATMKATGYDTTHITNIYLEEGDILVFEEEGRGYIKPVDGLVTIEEAIDDLENIKDLGGSDVQD